MSSPVRRDLQLIFLVVLLDDTFGNFNLAFQFLVYNICDISEGLKVAGTGTTENVGIALVILDQWIDSLPLCANLDFTLISEFFQESLRSYITVRIM